MNAAVLPLPTTCHQCGYLAAVAVCPMCKTERPALTALKNITAKQFGMQPVKAPLPACRYHPRALCDCGLRGQCVEAA